MWRWPAPTRQIKAGRRAGDNFNAGLCRGWPGLDPAGGLTLGAATSAIMYATPAAPRWKGARLLTKFSAQTSRGPVGHGAARDRSVAGSAAPTCRGSWRGLAEVARRMVRPLGGKVAGRQVLEPPKDRGPLVHSPDQLGQVLAPSVATAVRRHLGVAAWSGWGPPVLTVG